MAGLPSDLFRGAPRMTAQVLGQRRQSADILGLYSGPWPEVNVNIRREAVMRQTVDLEITSYSLAGGYRVSETLSLGLGLNLHHGRMSAVTESYGRPCGGLGYPPCGPDPTFFFERRMVPRELQETETLSIDRSDLRLSAGLYDVGSDEFQFPDVLALGVSFRSPDQRVTICFEWDRVEYSALIDGPSGLRLEDGDEIHLGAEYVFAESNPIVSLRLGLWRDPDHRLRYEGENYVAENLLRGGDDELHFAAGLGWPSAA